MGRVSLFLAALLVAVSQSYLLPPCPLSQCAAPPPSLRSWGVKPGGRVRAVLFVTGLYAQPPAGTAHARHDDDLPSTPPPCAVVLALLPRWVSQVGRGQLVRMHMDGNDRNGGEERPKVRGRGGGGARAWSEREKLYGTDGCSSSQTASLCC